MPPTCFDELAERKKRRRCKERQRRVGRRYDRPCIANERCVDPEDARPSRVAVAEQAEACFIEKVRSGDRAQQAYEANAKFRLPEDRRPALIQ